MKHLRAIYEWVLCLLVCIAILIAVPFACLFFAAHGIRHPLRAFAHLLDDLSRD
jgi:hypothetical protein